MRLPRPLSVNARSLLWDSHWILTVFIDLTHTYCIMVNLKCPPIYGRINGLREHDIVVGGVVVRARGCKCFGIALIRTASPCGNFEAVLLGQLLWYFDHIVAFARHVDVIKQWPLF